MSQARLIMKGKLAELRQKRLDLATKAASLVSALSGQVLPLEVVPLEEMETGQVLSLAQDLERIRGEYVDTMASIRKIEKELE